MDDQTNTYRVDIVSEWRNVLKTPGNLHLLATQLSVLCAMVEEAAKAEVADLRTELADVLEVAVSRGDQLGYESIRLIIRWQELTGEEWSDE